MKTVPMGSCAVVCDCCGSTGPIGRAFYDSVAKTRAEEMAKEDGWKEVSYAMLRNTLCPSCVEEHERLLKE